MSRNFAVLALVLLLCAAIDSATAYQGAGTQREYYSSSAEEQREVTLDTVSVLLPPPLEQQLPYGAGLVKFHISVLHSILRWP